MGSIEMKVIQYCSIIVLLLGVELKPRVKRGSNERKDNVHISGGESNVVVSVNNNDGGAAAPQPLPKPSDDKPRQICEDDYCVPLPYVVDYDCGGEGIKEHQLIPK